MSFRKWQLKAMFYALIITIVPVRHSGEMYFFGQMLIGMLTGSIA
jgi:hypothetical protein